MLRHALLAICCAAVRAAPGQNPPPAQQGTRPPENNDQTMRRLSPEEIPPNLNFYAIDPLYRPGTPLGWSPSRKTGDIDEDGFDEILNGSIAIDHDGRTLWSTGMGHGDRFYPTDVDPARPGLEIWYTIEDPHPQHGVSLWDARSGGLIFGAGEPTRDNQVAGGLVGDPDHPGMERGATSATSRRPASRSPARSRRRTSWRGGMPIRCARSSAAAASRYGAAHQSPASKAASSRSRTSPGTGARRSSRSSTASCVSAAPRSPRPTAASRCCRIRCTATTSPAGRWDTRTCR